MLGRFRDRRALVVLWGWCSFEQDQPSRSSGKKGAGHAVPSPSNAAFCVLPGPPHFVLRRDTALAATDNLNARTVSRGGGCLLGLPSIGSTRSAAAALARGQVTRGPARPVVADQER